MPKSIMRRFRGLPFWLVACLIVIALLFSWFELGLKGNEVMGVGANAAKFALDPQDILVYPNARSVEMPKGWYIKVGTRAFESMDHSSDVLAYYRKTLNETGWELIHEWSTQSPEFIKIDANASIPWILHLNLVVDANTSGNEKQTSPTSTSIIMDYWPEPILEQIPLYPNAHEIAIKNESAESPYIPNERVTTYVTTASVAEVEDFYKTILPQQGWELSIGYNWRWPEGIRFGFGSGSELVFQYGVVNIIAKGAAGKTTVQLRVSGKNTHYLPPVSSPTPDSK